MAKDTGIRKGKDIRTRKGKDNFYYPYTSPDLVIDNKGENQTVKNNVMKNDIQNLKDSQIILVEDDTNIDGISDTEHDTLETEDKRIIGGINEVNKKVKDVAINKADKNSVFTMANMGQDVKEAMTGGSVAVVGKNTILEENIVNKQVTPCKTNFIQYGNNLLDIDNLTPGYVYSNGEIKNGNYVTTSYIPFSTGAKINLSRMDKPGINKLMTRRAIRTACFYDSSYAVLSDFYYNNTGLTAEPVTYQGTGSVAYIRVSFQNTLVDNAMLYLGEERKEYEKNGVVINKLLLNENLKEEIETKINIGNGINGLKDKTILNFGDSISAGDGNNGVGYAELLAKKNGMTCYDYAVGGATITTSTNDILTQIEKAKNDKKTADYILFDGFTNDINTGAVKELGKISDGYSQTKDVNTFSGAFEEICYRLKTYWKGVPVFYVCVHKMSSRSTELQNTYSERAKTLCERWSISVIDIYREGGLNTYIADYKTSYTNKADGTHPNELGYNTFYVPLIEKNLSTATKASDTDLSKVTMSMNGQTLKLMNDGTQVATVEIPTATVTDEQLTNIIQSKIDDGTLTSITLGENSVKTSNLQDNSVTVAKLSNDILDVDTLEKYKVITIGDINLSKTHVTTSTVMPDGNKPTYSGYLSEKIKISTGGIYMVKGYVEKNASYGNQSSNYGFSGLNSMVYIFDKEDTFIKTGSVVVISPNFNKADVNEGEHIAYIVIPEGGGYLQFYVTKPEDNNYSNLCIYSNPCMIDNKYTTKCNIHDNYLSCVKDFNILNYDSLTIADGMGSSPYFVPGSPYLNEYGFVEFIGLNTPIIYIKMKLHYRFNADTFIRIFCYDENFNYINKIYAPNPFSSMDTNDVNVCFEVTPELPSNTKYVKVSFNGNFKTKFDLNSECFKISYAPFREDNDEHYIENDLLNTYVNEHITNSIDLKSYKFTKLGALNPVPPIKYTCWNNNTMIYDKDVDTFIQICRGRETHTTGTQKSYISKINAKTLQSEDIIEVKIANSVVSNAVGLWSVDNTYYSTCQIDNTVHRISSTDRGITWVDDGTVSGNKGNFYGIHKLSSGRLIGTHDDLVVPTSTKDKSYIDYSDDNGMTWTVVEINSSYPTVEQFFIELDDVLVMIGRRNGYPNQFTGKLRGYDAGICYSYDKGLTWTDCKKSNNLCMNCSNGVYFEHDGLIEIITIVRFSFNEISIRVPNRNGCIYHYVTTKELLLQDKYYLLETFYDGSSSFSNFHSPSIGIDSENNVLISYSSDETVTNLTELHYLYGTNKFNVRQNIVNDKRPSTILPYSGAKVEELLTALKKELISSLS